jgi:acetylglutamate kinase
MESVPIVVKIGGSTLGSHDTTLEDVALLHSQGRRLVVVHGGGELVTRWLRTHGVEARFLDGLRVTEADTLDVVVAVLAGLVNKQLVAQLNALGAPRPGPLRRGRRPPRPAGRPDGLGGSRPWTTLCWSRC